MKPDELKTRRKALKMTQNELAAALGVNISTVQRWESGETRPDGEEMFELALIALEAGYRGEFERPQVGDILYIEKPDRSKRYAIFVGKKHAFHAYNPERWYFDAVLEPNEERGCIWPTSWDEFRKAGLPIVEEFPEAELDRDWWNTYSKAFLCATYWKGQTSEAFVRDLKERFISFLKGDKRFRSQF